MKKSLFLAYNKQDIYTRHFDESKVKKEKEMIAQYIILVLLIGYLGWQLLSAIRKTPAASDSIRLVSRETGQILEMKLLNMEKSQSSVWDEALFLANAKIVFQAVSEAFASGNYKDLKLFLTPVLYSTFQQYIDERKKKNQKVDFSLIGFLSAKVVDKNDSLSKITVQFVTEQINLLKNENGEVIEGDPMSISTVSDTWTFKKCDKSSWIVCATKSEAIHA